MNNNPVGEAYTEYLQSRGIDTEDALRAYMKTPESVTEYFEEKYLTDKEGNAVSVDELTKRQAENDSELEQNLYAAIGKRFESFPRIIREYLTATYTVLGIAACGQGGEVTVEFPPDLRAEFIARLLLNHCRLLDDNSVFSLTHFRSLCPDHLDEWELHERYIQYIHPWIQSQQQIDQVQTIAGLVIRTLDQMSNDIAQSLSMAMGDGGLNTPSHYSEDDLKALEEMSIQ